MNFTLSQLLVHVKIINFYKNQKFLKETAFITLLKEKIEIPQLLWTMNI